MNVPYRHAPRPDTGMTNAGLGMGLFLAADAMFFGALFSSFAFLRTAAGYWPVGREVLPFGLNALAVVAVAGACCSAWRAGREARKGRGRACWRSLTAAAWGGLALFLAAGSYHQVWRDAGPPSANTFLAIYYVISASVTLHVLAASIFSMAACARPERDRAAAVSRLANLGGVWVFVLAMAVVSFLTFHVL